MAGLSAAAAYTLAPARGDAPRRAGGPRVALPPSPGGPWERWRVGARGGRPFGAAPLARAAAAATLEGIRGAVAALTTPPWHRPPLRPASQCHGTARVGWR